MVVVTGNEEAEPDPSPLGHTFPGETLGSVFLREAPSATPCSRRCCQPCHFCSVLAA